MTESSSSTLFSRRTIARAFQQHGLAAEVAAVDAMRNDILSREEEYPPQQVLEELLRELRERTLSTNTSISSSSRSKIVSADLLAQVVADWTRSGKDAADEALQLVDAFSMPRLHYDSMRQQFSLMVNEKHSLFGAATDKAEMLLQRYALIHQRILRQDLFRPHLGSADATRNTLAHKITPVESLLGTHGSQLLLGMIVQVEEGRFYLEDPTAQVPIRLVGASILTDGFITENSIVLVEGEYLDGILMVHRLGNPLIETRNEAIQAMGLQASDMFQSMSSLAEVQKIKEQEAELGPNRMFVILSDLHLDQPQVMSKLEVLLEGFCPDAMQDDDDDEEDDPLPVFIFMGNFSSVPLPPHVMMGHLDDLATLISKFPRLAQDARFVLIPGPNDPGMGQILPRPPLPKSITSSLRSKLRHVHFGSNPCRLRYFSKELVLFRQDVVHLLWRQSLLQPRDGTTEVQQHTVKTMLDQAHLCPVPIAAQPIYWTLDHALRLYPLPDAILCGDRVAQYYENYADCDALNAGPFYKDYSFVVYRPVAQVDEDGNTKSNVEFSQINSD